MRARALLSAVLREFAPQVGRHDALTPPQHFRDDFGEQFQECGTTSDYKPNVSAHGVRSEQKVFNNYVASEMSTTQVPHSQHNETPLSPTQSDPCLQQVERGTYQAYGTSGRT